MQQADVCSRVRLLLCLMFFSCSQETGRRLIEHQHVQAQRSSTRPRCRCRHVKGSNAWAGLPLPSWGRLQLHGGPAAWSCPKHGYKLRHVASCTGSR